MYGLFGLLPTSGENFKSTAPLEIYLLRKIVTCSILILPAVYAIIYYLFGEKCCMSKTKSNVQSIHS